MRGLQNEGACRRGGDAGGEGRAEGRGRRAGREAYLFLATGCEACQSFIRPNAGSVLDAR